MSGIAIYVENLEAFPADRARSLNSRLVAEALPKLDAIYALVWPDYAEPFPPRPQTNRALFQSYREVSGVPLWGWVNATSDQYATLAACQDLDVQLAPDGWLLDIEGKWMVGNSLSPLAKGVAALGRPRRASLAGASSSHMHFDFRSLDVNGFAVEWQAYFDSGEGPTPSAAVSELYAASFVHADWEYRHRLGSVYGWGRVSRVEATQRALFDSFKRPGSADGYFGVTLREWGWTVVSRDIIRSGTIVGLLMGRAEYKRIRVALDVTRTANERPAEEWASIAASARIPGSTKRGVAVYLGENTSDDVIVAIARGAA